MKEKIQIACNEEWEKGMMLGDKKTLIEVALIWNAQPKEQNTKKQIVEMIKVQIEKDS